MELVITTKWDSNKNKFVSSCYHTQANVTEEMGYVRYKLRERPIINGVEYYVSGVKNRSGGEEEYTLEVYDVWVEKNTIRRK